MTEIKKSDPESVKERAIHAKALLEDKAFQWAVLELRKRWFKELVDSGGGNQQSIELCSKINALEAIATELAIQINDYKSMVRNAA